MFEVLAQTKDEVTTQREGEEHATGVGFWTNATC